MTLAGTVVRTHGQVGVFVPVTLGGKKFEFVLDSGASSTIIDTSAAMAAGLTPTTAPVTVHTLGCTTKPKVAVVDDLTLGTVKLPTAKLLVQNLGFSSTRVHGERIGGLLGADVQAFAHVVSIDYTTGKVVFDAPPATSGTNVAVKILKGTTGVVVVAPVTVGAAHLAMQVDTGATRSDLDTAAATRLHLATAGAATSVNAAGCPAHVTPVTLAGAAIGTATVPRAVIFTSPKAPAVPGVVGFFGSDLLAHYGTVTIDYRTAKLTLGT